MKVMFIFPDGDVICTLEMDFSPRVGEVVSFNQVKKNNFGNKDEYAKYKEEEYGS
jgi:hypothetical protein